MKILILILTLSLSSCTLAPMSQQDVDKVNKVLDYQQKYDNNAHKVVKTADGGFDLL